MNNLFTLALGMLIIHNCNAQNVNIPNPWLKASILATNTTTNLKAKDLDGNWLKIDQNDDGEVQVAEALNVKYYYDANGGFVDSYEGISSFLNLEYLCFAYNQTPATMDLTGLSNLKTLICQSNSLTYLNLTGCTALELIDLDQNYLETLDVSGFTGLKTLRCQNNDLVYLLSDSTPSLVNFLCYSNELTTLDLSDRPDLEVLNCSGNALENLIFDNCSGLQSLRCDNNNLQTLTLDNYPNLTELFCSDNNLQTLSVNTCSSLVHLDCANNELTTLNINNGFNWVPSYDYTGNFSGQNNYDISQVCTSTASLPGMIAYYAQWTSNVSDCSSLGIAEQSGQNSPLAFYPNPADKTTYFYKIINKLSVYDMNGVLVKTLSPADNQLDVSGLSAGLYILKAETENGIECNRLIVK